MTRGERDDQRHERQREAEQDPRTPELPSQYQTDRLNDSSAYQQCFACGARNDNGLQLVFRQEGDAIVTEFTPDVRFQGFPGIVHGGILATVLDETLNRTATHEGRWMMTGRLEIRYRSVAPVGRLLRATARATSSRTRMLIASGEVVLADEPATIIATAEGTFLPVPADYRQQAVARFPALDGFFAI
jgi:acyl-coenzyme A thioesterase PaaI-like protein